MILARIVTWDLASSPQLAVFRMRISHLATSPNGSRLAAGEFERRVHVWDLKSRKRVVDFETVLDFGGDRLAISGDGRVCFAGAYRAHGIAAYSTSTGKVLWRRKDLKKVQLIRVSSDDAWVFCCFDRMSCQILDRRTGETVKAWPGVRRLWLSPIQPIALLEKKDTLLIQSLRDRSIAKLHGEPFRPLLAAAFAPDVCVVSECAGPLRCFDIKNGNERWRCSEPGEHFLDVGYVERVKVFAGIRWSFQHGGPFRLLKIDPVSGAIKRSSVLPKCTETAFCHRGSELLLNNGAIFDVDTGKRKQALAFPKR